MKSKSYHNGWQAAAHALIDYDASPCKSEILIKRFRKGLATEDIATLQKLFLSSLKNRRLCRFLLEQNISRKPRPVLYAALHIAVAELLEAPHPAQCVHFAVDQIRTLCSPAEAHFANAVLRKIRPLFDQFQAGAESDPSRWGLLYSYPEWLVQHWLQIFPAAQVRELLQWNQSIPEVYVRGFSGEGQGITPAQWSGFSLVDASGGRLQKLLETHPGTFVCDPSTAHPIALLDVQPAHKVLDLCAAPGGKSRQILQQLGSQGLLCSVDLPSERLPRLRENLQADKRARVLGADVLTLTQAQLHRVAGAASFDRVLLDAPCSNTGVLRRRADARWRLQEGDIEACSRLQLELLQKAAEFVSPGGLLVYSTCSIEPAENQAIADAFVRSLIDDFTPVGAKLSFPWQDGHDGGAAFAFKRNLK
ncbi:MAG: RsmB/NOP family class I SAM-dependent RNA methyltransferase [Opitutales bacterium]|nr:RsmB/NOP family class I SAM-dependent RNA methyltransferase [Opitutales bacterium]